MRDDVDTYLKNLLSLLETKRGILESLLVSEKDKLHRLKTDDISTLMELIQKDDGSIKKIGEINYHLAQEKEKICAIAGIKADDFEAVILTQKSDTTLQIRILYLDISSKLEILTRERESLILNMEEKKSAIGRELSSLKKTRQIKMN